MRISKTPNAIPHSTPPSSDGRRGEADAQEGDEQFVWASLVPRLVHPARLQIIEALIDKGDSMSVEELTSVTLADGNTDLVRYHAKVMVDAGVLEVRAADQIQGEGEELSLFLALPK